MSFMVISFYLAGFGWLGFYQQLKNYFMKKHLIIHGDSRSGKTLFVKTLISKKFGENYKELHGKFLKKKHINPVLMGKLVTSLGYKGGAIFFNDMLPSIPYDYFAACATEVGDCKMILEYGWELNNLPLDGSFRARFDVINTNAISYRDLMKFLNN